MFVYIYCCVSIQSEDRMDLSWSVKLDDEGRTVSVLSVIEQNSNMNIYTVVSVARMSRSVLSV